MGNRRPRFSSQSGYLPSQRFQFDPRQLQKPGKHGYRIAGYDTLQYVAGPLKEPLSKALAAFQEGRLGDALRWFAECDQIEAGNKAVLYFGSEAAQRAYFQLKLGDPTPPPEYIAKWRAVAVQISEGLITYHPDSVTLHNYARFIQDDGGDAESLALYEQALKLRRDQVESWGNYGTALLALGRRADAERAWAKCVAFPAENASGSMAQAYIWIRRGGPANWQRGWSALNERWNDRTFTDNYGRKDLKGIPWNGEPLKKGHTLLLHGEQGLGDHVMFARYAKHLQDAGHTIAGLETRAALKGWFDACWLGVPVVIRDQDPMPAYTHHVPMMSLPGILGLKEPPPPLAPTMPEPAPRTADGRRRIGLAWKGSRGNIMDGQRSLPDECLAVLNAVPNVTWVPLQHDPQGTIALEASMWLDHVEAPAAFTDVLGLAEVMRSCDHILCCDTLHAHVAGSLGLPTTVIHRYHREWRWGLDAETTPWYPNQRLVTCRTRDAWRDALTEAIQYLPTAPTAPIGTASLAPVMATEPPKDQPYADTIVTVLGRYGTFHVNRHDEYVGRSLLEYGEFSKAEGDLFQDLVRPSWHVVEVGANIGAHTKQLTMLAQHVTAYEPNPANATLLRLNAPRAEVIEAAVGKQPGQTTVDAPDPALPGNFGGLRCGRGGHAVPMVTLGASADFVKLDCEGMELDVLQGALPLMDTHPILYLEADRVSTAEPLLAFLHGRGYRCWWHVPPLYAPDNFKTNAVNVFGGIASVNLLAVPTHRPCPVDTLKHTLLPVETTTMRLIP